MPWIPKSKGRQIGVSLATACLLVLVLDYGSVFHGWEWPVLFLWPGWVVGIILFPCGHGCIGLLVATTIVDIALYGGVFYVLIRRIADKEGRGYVRLNLK